MSLQVILEGHKVPGGQQPLSTIETFGVAATAGVVTKSLIAPLERVKLLYQCQEELIRHGRICRPYFNIPHCEVKTFQREGFNSFWRGNMANIIRYIPTQSVMFGVKHNIQSDIAKQAPAGCNEFTQSFIAGGTAGAVALGLFYPLDLARNRLTLDTKILNKPQRLYSGLTDVYSKTLRTDGVLGLYRGLLVSLVGVVVYRGLFFGIYDHFKPQIFREKMGFLECFFLGYGATALAGTISFPLDTIRRRMVITTPDTPKTTSAISCAIRIIRLEGIKALWEGAMVNGMRAVSGGVLLALFDKFQIMYGRYKLG